MITKERVIEILNDEINENIPKDRIRYPHPETVDWFNGIEDGIKFILSIIHKPNSEILIDISNKQKEINEQSTSYNEGYYNGLLRGKELISMI